MIPGTDLHQFEVHNDGYFAHLPLNYVNGVILEMAVPRMPYQQLAEFLEEKCGCYFQGLYYQVRSQDLEKGLVRVSDDKSTSYMFDVEETFCRLNLYLDHLDMNLLKYLSQAITYDMDDLVFKKIGPPKKRYCNDFSVDEMVDWAEMEVETEGVEARTSTTEGIEARNSTTDSVEARNSTTEGVEARNKYESDDDSDYQSDKSVDYLSPGEDELIELRSRPRKKQPVDNFEDVYVNQRGPVRDEGESGTRGAAIGSRGRRGGEGIVGSRGGASGLISRGAGGSGDASRSRGRGTAGSRGGASGSRGRGAGGSKRKPVSIAGTQKRQGKKKVGKSGFAKWFGLQDEPEQS
ncbi:hypothetical protein Tco_0451587 [Tanacetum coccineum]